METFAGSASCWNGAVRGGGSAEAPDETCGSVAPV